MSRVKLRRLPLNCTRPGHLYAALATLVNELGLTRVGFESNDLRWPP